MNGFKFLALAAAVAICLAAVPSTAPAQVEVGIGVAPVCPYGYYDVPPYDCAPYGYYGPEWFSGGVFIGAGPWFHGFHGRPGHYGRPGFDVHRGFRGPVGRGPEHYDRAPVGRGFHGGYDRSGPARGGFHGGRGR